MAFRACNFVLSCFEIHWYYRICFFAFFLLKAGRESHFFYIFFFFSLCLPQACAYKVGEIKIKELRKKAEQKLGKPSFTSKNLFFYFTRCDIKEDMILITSVRIFFRGEVWYQRLSPCFSFGWSYGYRHLGRGCGRVYSKQFDTVNIYWRQTISDYPTFKKFISTVNYCQRIEKRIYFFEDELFKLIFAPH